MNIKKNMKNGGRIELLKDFSALGEEHGVFKVKKSLLVTVFLFFAALLFLFVSLMSIFTSDGIGSIFFCTLPLALLAFVFLMMLRDIFLSRSDELRIYKNGFIYKDRKQTHICRWEEVDFFEIHRTGRLLWAQKLDGEIIFFADDLQGTKELIQRYGQQNKSGSASGQADPADIHADNYLPVETDLDSKKTNRESHDI